MSPLQITGKLVQISRSRGGLPKLAAEGPVLLTASGVEGDRQRNLKYHGGPNQAVLMIAQETIEALAARGFPVGAGSLGENLTVSGFDPHTWRAGQRLRIGPDAMIELTKLRQPCLQLDVYGASIKRELYDAACAHGDTSSVKWAHGGFYGRVIDQGIIRTGDAVNLLQLT